jgi:serine/threonine-protein kinase
LGNYRIVRQIGQGGMSRVFRAAELTTNRTVAIKVLAPAIAHDAGFQARFAREIEILRRLQHPNIVPILDHGSAHGMTFIVMPFIATGTLHERLRQGPLDLRLVGRIVDQVAAALHFAHENGVVHRDVKPSNVLMDRHGNALLSDFSLARPQDPSQNLTGSSLVGTPAYMSPEQCRGDPVDARSDQYSFAVMLFQMVTGQLPFEGETPMALAMKHVSTPLPFPREVNPNLPQGVELVLIKALAKDAALRFASVLDLNRAFQLALRGVLDPRSTAVSAPTLDRDRTLLYQRYQNASPPIRRRRYDRSALLAGALLLLSCSIAAGAVALVYPELFYAAKAAPQAEAVVPDVDIQATVDVVLTANAAALGPSVPASVLQTRVYAAVMQTLEATLTPPEAQAVPAVALGDATLPATLVFPTSKPTATRTRTPVATRTSAATATSSGPTTTGPAASATPTLPAATATGGGASATVPAATSTSSPPTNTSAPPTATPSNAAPTNTVAPTNTAPAMVCDWHQGGPSVSGDTVSVRLYNDGDLVVHVSRVSITWSGSDHLRRIRWRFEGPFWSGNDEGPTVSAGTNKNVPVGTYRTAEFEFWGSDFDGSASVSFDADC